MFKSILLILFCISCTHMDYVLQKPVKLDPKQTDSELRILIRDDEIVRDKYYPSAYLYVYVDEFLVYKDHRSLTKKDRYQNKFYASFDKLIKIKQGKHRVKIKYYTYRLKIIE